MKLKNLIAISLIHIICVNYANTISCYVCNSFYDSDCDQINESTKIKYKKDCGEVANERLAYFEYNASSKQFDDNNDETIDCAFCKAVENRSFTKCRTLRFEIKDYNGEDEKRTIRDCAGVFDIDNGCHYTKRNHYKLADCVCDSDGCNDNVNQVYNNAYIIVFFLIVSFLFN